MKNKIITLTVSTMLFALCFFRVGAAANENRSDRLFGWPFPAVRSAAKLSGKGCASLGTSRGKTLSLSGDLERENPNVSLRSQPS